VPITLTADTVRSVLVATAVGQLSVVDLQDFLRPARTG
jgi:hypothetical protein